MKLRLVVVVLALVAACQKKDAAEQVVPAAIDVIEDSIILKSGDVGVRAPAKQPATYVLVDIENGAALAHVVSAEGVLVDAAGKEVDTLAIDELRIPAGERRTFALVGTAPHPEATGARVTIRRATPATQESPLAISDIKEERDDGGLVVSARLTNTLDQPIVATLVASFHDEAGRILARPFQIFEFGPKQSRPWRVAGPKAATKVQIYPGEMMY